MDYLLGILQSYLGPNAEIALALAGAVGAIAPSLTQQLKQYLPEADAKWPPQLLHRGIGAVALLGGWFAIGGGAWWSWMIVGACGTWVSELGYRVGKGAQTPQLQLAKPTLGARRRGNL